MKKVMIVVVCGLLLFACDTASATGLFSRVRARVRTRQRARLQRPVVIRQRVIVRDKFRHNDIIIVPTNRQVLRTYQLHVPHVISPQQTILIPVH